MTHTRLTTALVGLLACSLLAAGAGAAAAPTLSLTDASAPQGETVTVTLATDASDVAGYQANLTYDPSVLRVQSVRGADYDDPVVNVNNDAGWVFLTQSRADGVDAPRLATVTFEVVGDTGERSAVDFVSEETLVNDADAEPIEVSTDAATVSVGDAGTNDAGPLNAVPSDPLGLGVGLPVYAAGGLGLLGVLGAGVALGRRL